LRKGKVKSNRSARSRRCFPVPMRWADARIHVEQDSAWRTARVNAVDPLAGKVSERRTRAKAAPETPCRRQSIVSPDHGAVARRRSRPSIPRADQIPTVGTTRPMRADRSCQCVPRPEHHSPSSSARAPRRDSRQLPCIRGDDRTAKLDVPLD
jgi:hypothetical protein